MSDKAFGTKEWVELFEEIGLSKQQMHGWHQVFENRYPEKHEEFLSWIGMGKEEIAEVRREAKKS